MIKSKSIQTLVKDACTGCKLCGDVCPKDCISFSEDLEGFLYPVVSCDSCIECGLCSRVCPALNVSQNHKTDIVLSAFASDVSVKESGSSGGLFFLLASSVLRNGGVVYGAAFDEHLTLKHQRVDNIRDLRLLCKSKYLQSNCEGAYNKIKTDLSAGHTVVFAGTPCQCQALRNFIDEKKSKNLLLIDFVCHGVPNQKLFDENLEWTAKKYGRVRGVEFRYKGKNVKHPQTLRMTYEINGKEKSMLRMHYQDPYYFGFQKHLTLRPSCYQCQWAKPERCSDITLADFWGIEKTGFGLNSKDGVSCVLLNTEKGSVFFSHIKAEIGGVNEFAIEFAVANNECLGSPTKKPTNREKFFNDWRNMGYDAVVNEYLIPKHKWVFDLYYFIPTPIRKIIRKIMENRMRYE